jgi:hypothetical protein
MSQALKPKGVTDWLTITDWQTDVVN